MIPALKDLTIGLLGLFAHKKLIRITGKSLKND